MLIFPRWPDAHWQRFPSWQDEQAVVFGLGIPILVATLSIGYHFIHVNPQKVPKRRRPTKKKAE